MVAGTSVREMADSNRRYWPRMNAGISFGYRVVPAEVWEETAKVWTSSLGPAVEGAGFHAPDPFMEFSPGGLKFDDVAGVAAGDNIIAALSLPSHNTVWHVTARVVRVALIPEEEREPPGESGVVRTHRIAIEFLSMPPRAREALFELTERLQDLEIMTVVESTGDL